MPQETTTPKTPMKLKTKVRAGGIICKELTCENHNQTLAQSNKPKPMKLKTALKAGERPGEDCPRWGCGVNHNQTLAQSNKSMKLKTKIKAGAGDGTGGGCPVWGCGSNHNQTLATRR
jgi:hypothetical protein